MGLIVFHYLPALFQELAWIGYLMDGLDKWLHSMNRALGLLSLIPPPQGGEMLEAEAGPAC